MRIKKIILNPTKSEYMIIDHLRKRKKEESQPQLFINREKIEQVDETKYLGVIIDDTFGWKNCMDFVMKKVYSNG